MKIEMHINMYLRLELQMKKKKTPHDYVKNRNIDTKKLPVYTTDTGQSASYFEFHLKVDNKEG